MTRYGRKGGDSPNTGKKATTYIVALPDGTSARKRDFNPPADPVGYAYEHGGKWHLAAIGERNEARFSHYTQCPAARA